MLKIRYVSGTGEITGVFPEGAWEGVLPEGMETLDVYPEDEEEVLLSPESFYVADDGSGPALYRRREDAAS